jgi:hypothetical protein
VGVLFGGPGVRREASLQGARTLLQQLDTLHLFDSGDSSPPQLLLPGLPCVIIVRSLGFRWCSA